MKEFPGFKNGFYVTGFMYSYINIIYYFINICIIINVFGCGNELNSCFGWKTFDDELSDTSDYMDVRFLIETNNGYIWTAYYNNLDNNDCNDYQRNNIDWYSNVICPSNVVAVGIRMNSGTDSWLCDTIYINNIVIDTFYDSNNTALNGIWLDYGFDARNDSESYYSIDLNGNILSNDESYIMTNSPTKNPTNRPTNRPTIFQSNSPTMNPTENMLIRSLSPTISTLYPTIYPTLNPFKSPTDFPSNNPTLYPTYLTYSPSISSNTPTNDDQTLYPSNQPSTLPTNDPTSYPTYSTYSPSIQLTNTSSIITQLPTSFPTNIVSSVHVPSTINSNSDEKTSQKLIVFFGIIICSICCLFCTILLLIIYYVLKRKEYNKNTKIIQKIIAPNNNKNNISNNNINYNDNNKMNIDLPERISDVKQVTLGHKRQYTNDENEGSVGYGYQTNTNGEISKV